MTTDHKELIAELRDEIIADRLSYKPALLDRAIERAFAALRTASQVPQCADCTTPLLYECPGCSATNYPPPTPASASEAVPVAYRFQDRLADGTWTDQYWHKLPPWEHRNAVPLYTRPAPASGEPAYDRELIARALLEAADKNATRYASHKLRGQASLLRAADNRDAAGARTVQRADPAVDFAFVNHGDTEAKFIADADHLNCPACGGSGHVDDASGEGQQGGQITGWRMVDGLTVFTVATASGIADQEFVRLDDAKALAEQQRAGVRHLRHDYVPNKEYPWFCAKCGYAEHEMLKHAPTHATQPQEGAGNG